MLFKVTYETITPESAEHGEAESRGFVSEGVSLREALEDMGHGSQGVEASEWPVTDPRWITAYCVNDGTRAYFELGVTENRSLHFPDNMTPASKRRVCRLVNCLGM